MRLPKDRSIANEEESLQRRTFLKKAVYAAPTLMALGNLAKPVQTHADFGGPPSDPDFPDEQQSVAAPESEPEPVTPDAIGDAIVDRPLDELK